MRRCFSVQSSISCIKLPDWLESRIHHLVRGLTVVSRLTRLDQILADITLVWYGNDEGDLVVIQFIYK